MAQLRKRFRKKLIYTYVGDILISVNPFTKLDLYSTKVDGQAVDGQAVNGQFTTYMSPTL